MDRYSQFASFYVVVATISCNAGKCSRLVAADLHGHRARNAGAFHVADCRAAQVVEQQALEAGRGASLMPAVEVAPQGELDGGAAVPGELVLALAVAEHAGPGALLDLAL